jgi:ABC-type arginine transport system ATPase subunit
VTRRPRLADITEHPKMEFADYERRLASLQGLLQLVQQAYLGTSERALIVLEGWDTAGKGGVVRRLGWALDPRSFKVHPIAAPDEHERAQHYLQRFWRHLPEKGQIVAFDRSWYGRVLVERVAWSWSRSESGLTTVGAVLSATPTDFIVMTYVDEGRDIAFSQASPGQQASALLELLLHQAAGTLIIDQPEDDLDNRVIMRIVELIRTSKNHRQLIFATHNPNVVVNGDADKVIALRSGEPAVGAESETPRVQLFKDGAIETADVRDAITLIMEGGKEAFDT